MYSLDKFLFQFEQCFFYSISKVWNYLTHTGKKSLLYGVWLGSLNPSNITAFMTEDYCAWLEAMQKQRPHNIENVVE